MSNKNRRGGLGRGLGALIPTAPPADEQAAGTTEDDQPAGSPAASPAGTERRADYAAAAVPVVTQPVRSADAPEPTAPEPAAPTDAAPEQTTAEPAAPADAAPGDPARADASADIVAPPVNESLAPAGPPVDGLVPVVGAHFVEVPVDEIRPNPKQPRQVFDEQALEELTHSIREFGVLQPIVVRAVSSDGAVDGPGGPRTYELVMGERRLRAATAAGLTNVPAIVRTTADDAMLRDALLENIHRAQLNPLEEAAAYQQLLEEFGATHDELAVRIGRSRPQVSNTIRLLNLPVPVQRRVAAGILSAGHARALLSVDDRDAQEDLAGRIVAEGLSVRATEELVALHAQGHSSGKRPRKALGPRITAPALVELANRLSDAFDTRVKVDLGRSKGKITVEFATIDDLERIVGVMSGQLTAHPSHPMHDVGAAFDRIDPVAADGDVRAAELTAAESGEPTATGSLADGDGAADGTVPTDHADPMTDAAAADASTAMRNGETSSGAGQDYAGWSSDHVPDLGAWDDRIRYDPNAS